MSKSSIEWTDHSWNPISGCTKISLGCKNCYAERMARRLAGRFGYPEAPRHFDVTFHPNKLDEPLERKKPTAYFVCSMGDLFHSKVANDWRCAIWCTMEVAKQHTFLVLTKRAGNMLDWVTWVVDNRAPLHNIYLGVTVENQATADERRADFEATPAAVKFVSYEPALGPIDWTGWGFVDQIISGGESGPGARPSHPDWHRGTRDFCQKHDIAYFMKQWGAWAPIEAIGSYRYKWALTHNTQRILVEPHTGLQRAKDLILYRVGKKRAGRLLDGREWNEAPA